MIDTNSNAGKSQRQTNKNTNERIAVSNIRAKGREGGEVSSNMIHKFDGDDNGENNDEEGQYQPDKDDGYTLDAIFGRDIKPRSTLRHNNGSRNNNRNNKNQQSQIITLEQALMKERRNKCALFAVLVIVTITCLSTIVSQKQELKKYSYQQGEYTNGYSTGADNGVSGDEFYGNRYYNEYPKGDKGFGHNANIPLKNEDNIYYDANGDEDRNKDPLFFGPSDNQPSDYSSSNLNDKNDFGSDGGGWQEEKPETSFKNVDSIHPDEFDPIGMQNNENKNGNNSENESSFENEDSFVYQQDNINALINRVDRMNIKELAKRFSNVDIPFSNNGFELPLLFYIPRTGANLQEQLLTKCHGIVAASGKGVLGNGRGDENYLEVVKTPSNEHYVNVDLKTDVGVSRAIELDLVASKLAGVAFSSRIHLASEIFHLPFRGKCFTFFRHPIPRAISLFYALKESPWENSFKQEFSKMTIEDYVYSDYAESNWLVRMLTNKMTGAITSDDLENAKQFLKAKCLIGLTDNFIESHTRVEKYFGWENSIDRACEKELLGMKDDTENERKRQLDGDIQFSQDVYDQLNKQNQLDIALYEYAVRLFDEQARFFTK